MAFYLYFLLMSLILCFYFIHLESIFIIQKVFKTPEFGLFAIYVVMGYNIA